MNQDLLSLVQEFYDEKAAEEERLEQLKKRSTSLTSRPASARAKTSPRAATRRPRVSSATCWTQTGLTTMSLRPAAWTAP